MARFATPTVRTGPVQSIARTVNYNAGSGWVRDPKSELFLTAITTLLQDTYYETADDRITRLRSLVHTVVPTDPEFVARLVPYCRQTLNLRSVAVVLAAEYVKAGGPNGRSVVASALQRPDEPGEMLAYWHHAYGRNEPKPVKRGVADAVTRLYNEQAILRYDGTGRGWRFGDVIERVHPVASADWQVALFKHCLDRRRHGNELPPEPLTSLLNDAMLQRRPENERRLLLNDAAQVMSWERLSGWLPGGMDADAWGAVIPKMGYMALLRNLRNFDQAGVNPGILDSVMKRLTDPAEVAKSRQMPFRFFSAYKEMQTERWSWPLEQALNLSLQNVPALPGRTLILVDTSGSMSSPGYTKSKILPVEQAAIFGTALAKSAEQVDLYAYDEQVYGIDPKHPILRIAQELGSIRGGATYTMQALQATYQSHDRVVILTDEQANDAGSPIPNARIYTFVIGGYKPAQLREGDHFTFGGGMSDASFTLLATLEQRGHGTWPHLQ